MPSTRPSSLTRAQLLQIALITAAALALFVVVRRLPTGTNLGHMDFRVSGGNSIEFCDPANPQFLPVVAVPSPVTMTLSPGTAERDQPQAFGLTLRTVTGKPIGPADLAVAHTRKLHLLVIDPTLSGVRRFRANRHGPRALRRRGIHRARFAGRAGAAGARGREIHRVVHVTGFQG